MKTVLCITLLVLILAADADGAGHHKCHGNGRMLRQFNSRKEDTEMPCKYHAVRQVCGNYTINLTPGNIYLTPKYYLDTLWLSIKEVNGFGKWEGRTDNKISVKYLTGWKDQLFHQKGGNLSTAEVLTFGKSLESTWAEATNGDFRVTFTPWDPETPSFNQSKWSFECFSDNFEASGYPTQVCGGDNKKETKKRYIALGLEGRQQLIYYDVFTNTAIEQTSEKCEEAAQIMTYDCTEEQRKTAIITCSQMLSSAKHTRCITKYACEPMNAFVDCLTWVCSDFTDTEACERIGRAIDMCRTFKGGNLTAKVEEAKCYQDFLRIRFRS